jgi:hypothetical protein
MERIDYINLPEEIQKHYYKNKLAIKKINKNDKHIYVYHSEEYDIWHYNSTETVWKIVLEKHLPEIDREKAVILNFRYYGGSDRNPRVLVFGSYQHNVTGSLLLCGLNLNYLDEQEIEELRSNLKDIYLFPDHNHRFEETRWKIPDIYQKSYRTYKVENITEESLEEMEIPENNGT